MIKNSFSILTLLVFVLVSCSKPSEPTSSVYSVEMKSHTSSLSFNGTIMPLKTTVLTSPADGSIVNMLFQYGDQVKKNQTLYQLSSAKFISDYKTALLQYLKAKSDDVLNQTQLSEAKFLHQHKLISDDDFKMKQSNYYASRLTLLESEDVLQNIVTQLHLQKIDLTQLSISNIENITKALHIDVNSNNVEVVAPADGIVLTTNKSDENKRYQNGDTVKQGDTVALIGDLSGISMLIKVNEMTVNQLAMNQTVIVTGQAFPNVELKGFINRIDHQGEMSSNGIPTFTVEIIVPHLSQSDQAHIYIGMTANITINLETKPNILIPINAVKELHGQTFVTILGSNRKPILKSIETGNTTLDSVVVLSGLQSGDKIVVPNQA